MKKYTFYLPDDDKEDIDFLDSKVNISDSMRNLVHNARISKPIIDEDLESKKREKLADIRFKEARADCKESEALWWKDMKSPPSHAAKSAMVEYSRSSNQEKPFRELTENEINVIVKSIALENTFNGWRITCLHCKLETTYKNRLEALHDAARHLSAVHGTKIL